MGACMDKSSCHWLQIHSAEKGQLQKGKTIISAAYSRVLAATFWFLEELLSYQVGILYESTTLSIRRVKAISLSTDH